MNHHEWCHDVAVLRSFLHRAGEIIDFADDVLRADQPSEPFRRRGLTIPARSATRRLRQRKQAPATTQQTPPAEVRTTDASPTSAIRAEQLLRSQMAAPRAKSLAPVLSTLQPDQYDLVTSPAAGSILVEGQPGTGKTIIASHRAAWLINQDNAAQGAVNTLDGDVLLVGPTDGYVNHVRSVINRLTGNSARVLVRSIPQLAREIAPGIPPNSKGRASSTWRSVDAELGRLILKAIAELQSAHGTSPSAEEAFEYFRSNGNRRAPLTLDSDWIAYLDGIPEFKTALEFRVAEPLISFLTWQIAPPRRLANIHHIIVDEAQDVNPLEWQLLRCINNTGSWTIIGDLNQRRSDHTVTSWDQARELLGVKPGALEIRRLERGYRSTRPILAFANRLLPETERELLAFQHEGPAPTILRTAEGKLPDIVLSEIRRLRAAYPAGTLAVIGTDLIAVQTRLRRDGWKAANTSSTEWLKDGKTVSLLHHDAARGLEFDAVVVIEPASFPKNFGRRGPLYTALTRPNRELSLVHSQPLPDELKARRLATPSALTTLDREIDQMEEEFRAGKLSAVTAADQIRSARETVKNSSLDAHDREELVRRLDVLTQQVDERRANAIAEKELKRRWGLEAKERLVTQAEHIAAGTDWKHGGHRLRLISDELSRPPRPNREAESRLQRRLSVARETFFRRRRDAATAATLAAAKMNDRPIEARRAQARMDVLRRKQFIVKEAQRLAYTDDYNRVSKRLKKLRREWDAAPLLDRSTESELKRKFRKAQSLFDQRRRQALSSQQTPLERQRDARTQGEGYAAQSVRRPKPDEEVHRPSVDEARSCRRP